LHFLDIFFCGGVYLLKRILFSLKIIVLIFLVLYFGEIGPSLYLFFLDIVWSAFFWFKSYLKVKSDNKSF
jgi:hypothetical protein